MSLRPPDSPGPTVPLLDLQAQYQPLRGELLAAIERVCDSQRFIMGPEVDALERELAHALGVTHAVSMSSGTDAILATLMALGVLSIFVFLGGYWFFDRLRDSFAEAV